MNYKVNFDEWNGAVAVPRSLIDKHLKMAGALQLKVALWVYANALGSFSDDDIANALRMQKSDIADALSYWIEAGFFCEENGAFKQSSDTELKPTENINKNSNENINTEKIIEMPKRKRVLRPDSKTVTERIAESPEMAYLMEEAQRILGRTISPALTSLLVAVHDDYGLPADVIALMLQYCSSVKKTSTQYIDAMAKDWAESEIFTADKAVQKISQLSEINIAWKKIQGVLDMPYRNPVRREIEYTEHWVMEWKFSLDMIREAYERCIENTSKLSMGYMNKILERWHKQGISTVEQAMEDSEKRKQSQSTESSFSVDELEAFDITNDPRINL